MMHGPMNVKQESTSRLLGFFYFYFFRMFIATCVFMNFPLALG